MLTLALLPPINDWVYIVVYTIYAITILGTIVIIITENRNPVKSLAWVLVLAFLPIVGLVFYIFFGQNFKAKRMVSRRIKRKLRKRDYHSIVNIDSLPLNEESKQEIRLCHSLCSVPYYSGSHVKIFTSGEDKFKHYLQDLEIAQEYIHIQYYIFEDDKLGNRVKEVLLRCARRGIQIRILYDDVGCWSVKKRFFKEMQDAGIAVRPFLEITFPQLASRINYRNHRKITVIDGKVGFIGGINISDEYINKKERFGHWKDTGLMFKGPGVENLTIMFLEMWNAFEEKEGGYRDFVPAEYEEKGGEGDGYILSFSDSPLDDENASENVYADILYNANDYVYITTPYLAIDSSLQNALCLAAKRGVDVRLITPGIPDKKMVYRLTRSYYASLIRAGVKIYEYTPGFVHAKSYVADDKIGVVGTINMDYRSLYLHFECGTLMYDSPAVIDLRNDDLATIEKCRKIELSDCRTSFFGELIDRVLRVIAPLL